MLFAKPSVLLKELVGSLSRGTSDRVRAIFSIHDYNVLVSKGLSQISTTATVGFSHRVGKGRSEACQASYQSKSKFLGQPGLFGEDVARDSTLTDWISVR